MTPEQHRQLELPCGYAERHDDYAARGPEDDPARRPVGNLLACGSLYDIKAKDIGAGVYRVSLRLTHP